jgi:hypothetical protein
LTSCHRPDSLNGESVHIHTPNGEANLGIVVDTEHYKTPGVALRILIDLVDTVPAPSFSDLKLAVFDAEGRTIPFTQFDPGREFPPGAQSGGGSTWSYYYRLSQLPASAQVTWNKHTYFFRKLRHEKLLQE